MGRHVRDHDISSDLLNSKNDYIERLKDDADEPASIVANISQNTAGLGQCLGIYLWDAADQIDDFDRDTFVAGVTSDGDETSDVTPIDEISMGGNPYVTVIVEVTQWESGPDGGPAETGTVSDATGTVDLIDFFGASHVGDRIESGEMLRIEDARVSEYNGTLQLEVIKNTTTVTAVEPGTGTLSESDDDSGGDGDADEGATETTTADEAAAPAEVTADGGIEVSGAPVEDMIEYFADQDGADPVGIDEVIEEVGIDEGTAVDVLMQLRDQGRIYEPEKGKFLPVSSAIDGGGADDAA